MFPHLLTISKPQLSPKDTNFSANFCRDDCFFLHTPRTSESGDEVAIFLLPSCCPPFWVKHPVLLGPCHPTLWLSPTSYPSRLQIFHQLSFIHQPLPLLLSKALSSLRRTTTTMGTVERSWPLSFLTTCFQSHSPMLHISTYFWVPPGTLSSSGIAPVPKALD